MDKSKKLNMLLKANNATHTKDIDLLSQKTKADTIDTINNLLLLNMMVVKNTTIVMINNLLLINTMMIWNVSPFNWYPILFWEKKKTVFTNGLTSMFSMIITPIHLQKEIKWGNPTHLMLNTVFSTLPKPNITENWRYKLWAKYLNDITSRIFTLANVNYKHRTFDANY